MKIVQILLILFISLSGCKSEDELDGSLLLVNNSSIDVYFYYSINLNVGHFPNVDLPDTRPNGLQPIISNGSSGTLSDPNWESIYNDLPEGLFSMYVFSQEVVDNTPWEQVRDDYLILERFDITFEELVASDYIITYTED